MSNAEIFRSQAGHQFLWTPNKESTVVSISEYVQLFIKEGENHGIPEHIAEKLLNSYFSHCEKIKRSLFYWPRERIEEWRIDTKFALADIVLLNSNPGDPWREAMMKNVFEKYSIASSTR